MVKILDQPEKKHVLLMKRKSLGVMLYLSATQAFDRKSNYALWALVVLLLVLQVISYQGTPPPSGEAVAWVGLAGGSLNVLWAVWIDKHRRERVKREKRIVREDIT